MAETEQSTGSTAAAGIDETIQRMEKLYKVVTGAEVPPADTVYAAIPAEKDPSAHVEEQMNRLITMLAEVGTGTETTLSWTPPVCVWESEKEIILCMDLPGVKREQVKVTTQGNLLVISGWRSSARNHGFRLSLLECPTGKFQRTMIIPAAARGSELNAQMRDGVLEVKLQKEAEQVTTPRTVRVS